VDSRPEIHPREIAEPHAGCEAAAFRRGYSFARAIVDSSAILSSGLQAAVPLLKATRGRLSDSPELRPGAHLVSTLAPGSDYATSRA
jgi:hypothetical protein